jgi:hypothetical protein
VTAGGFYLPAGEYWVPPDEASAYPLRQGDLLGPTTVAGELWTAALIVHPTCELAKRSVERIQVARVRLLSELADGRQRTAVVAGVSETGGALRVAFAHTFFVAPATGDGPLWCDLRDIVQVPRDALAARVAAMTHDARVTFIRRYAYFRFRILLSFDQVRALEAARIAADPAFSGPRPAWASA